MSADPLLRWALLLVVGLVCWQASGWLLLAMYRWQRGRMALLAPAARARLLLLIALVPALVSITVCLLLFAVPGSLLTPSHCHAGQGCGAHAPLLGAASLYLPAWNLGLSLVAGLGPLLLLLALAARRQQRQLRWMQETRDVRGFGVLDTESPLALTAGLVFPQVFVSRGLLALATPAQLAIILAHENAHAARRDNLRLQLARGLLPAAGGEAALLLDDLGLACEESADAAGAAFCGSRLAVAEALLAVQRRATPGRARDCGFAGHDVRVRVSRLLRPPHYRQLEAPFLVLVLLLAAAQVWFSTGLVHRLIEVVLVAA